MMIPNWIKAQVKRSKLLVALRSTTKWKLHVLKDWWGTRVWTYTTEVVTPQGFKLTSGFHPAYQLMRTGRFEVDETALLTRMLTRADRFIDIGANLGYYTCLALQQGKPVVAFEPQTQNLQCLYRNLLANGWLQGAEVVPVALSDRVGLLELYGASGPSASLIKNWAGYSSRYRQMVPVSTLDNILGGRFSGQRLLLKIDVEGAEHAVLKGARATLARDPKPTWLVEICLQEFHPEGFNPDFRDIFQLFWEHGYEAYAVAATLQRVTPEDVERWWITRKTDYGTFNYLFASPADLPTG